MFRPASGEMSVASSMYIVRYDASDRVGGFVWSQSSTRMKSRTFVLSEIVGNESSTSVMGWELPSVPYVTELHALSCRGTCLTYWVVPLDESVVVVVVGA